VRAAVPCVSSSKGTEPKEGGGVSKSPRSIGSLCSVIVDT
jgi:hypothetical protein